MIELLDATRPTDLVYGPGSDTAALLRETRSKVNEVIAHMCDVDFKVTAVLSDIAAEYGRAIKAHSPFNGPHEGWAVIFEELDELWDEVKATKPSDPRQRQMRKEAIQTAAMALRFVIDVTDKE